LGGGAEARAQDIRGSDVQRSNGDTLGEIDQVMIDPSRGRIAYLLLSSGGFLGIGNDWLPVPPEAVSWSPDKNAYVLNDKNVKPAAMQVLHKTDLPGEVQRSQLEALYQRFNLRPYWERGTSQNQG
jgi:sporulation protein YlmC with PRC-barrel domain